MALLIFLMVLILTKSDFRSPLIDLVNWFMSFWPCASNEPCCCCLLKFRLKRRLILAINCAKILLNTRRSFSVSNRPGVCSLYESNITFRCRRRAARFRLLFNLRENKYWSWLVYSARILVCFLMSNLRSEAGRVAFVLISFWILNSPVR